MPKYRNALLATAAILFASLAVEARSADMAPPSESSDWVFTGGLYLWGSGLEGSSGVSGFTPQDIDISFSDVVENLDMAFMGAGEARNGPYSIGMDISYARLETNVDTPRGILADDVDITAQTFMGTAFVGYSVIDTGSARLDAIAGARVWSVSTDFEFNGGIILDGRSADDGATWVDPLVGARFKADLGPDFYVSGWGMIGGFGISSDLMWDAMAGIGYEFTDSFAVLGGYRAVSVDYSDDGFVYDVVQQGPFLAGVFRF